MSIRMQAQNEKATQASRSLALQRKCGCDNLSIAGECSACRKKRQSTLQRAGVDSSRSDTAPPIVHAVLRSPGHPLDAGTRAFMESRFGHDFSQVRVHTDARAAESARAVDARAYTVGRNVVFGARHYDPGSRNGRMLLAHELTHTIQQGNATVLAMSRLAISPVNDPAEREARLAAQLVSEGKAYRPGTKAKPFLAREEDDAPAAAPDEAKPTKCPRTYTIPDDVHKAIDEAWKLSGHGEEENDVAEHGGRIVTDKEGNRVIRTGSGGSGGMSLPEEEEGDVTLGTYHTHPYSKEDDSPLGVAFSAADIVNFVEGGQGSVKYVGAGSCYFILNTLDQAKRDACKSENLEERYDSRFNRAVGTFQRKVRVAVKSAIRGCGLCFYKACRRGRKKSVPKTAKLA